MVPVVQLRGPEQVPQRAGRQPDVLELRGAVAIRLAQISGPAKAESLARTAEHDLRDAVAARPTMARAWVSLSRALKFRGDFSGADRAAARALAVDAYLVDAHRAAGDLFFGALGRGDYKGAGDLCAAGRRYYGSARSFVECRLTLLGWSANSREDVRLGWELLQEIELQGSSTELAETWGFRRLMVAAVAAPFLISVNQFRPTLESELSAALGREVKLGNLQLKILSGEVTADDLSVAEDPAFGKPAFLRAKSLHVGVELWPFLVSRKLIVTDLTIDRPEIAPRQRYRRAWPLTGAGRDLGEDAG